MEKPDIVSGFQSVDQASDSGHYVSYLDNFTASKAAQEYKRRTFDILELREGSRVLDVGCGTGDDALALAHLVGANGKVVGIDNSEAMIAEARRRALDVNIPVEFRAGDAHSLDFEDCAFDGTRADRVYQHLAAPKRALEEMARVTRHGGRLVIADPDWETFVVDTPDVALTRRILNARCDGVPNGWMGRQLFRLFHECGLTNVRVAPIPFTMADYRFADQLVDFHVAVERAVQAKVISTEEGASWLESLVKSARAGCFLAR